ncbi:MAG: SDR family oxidoreductase [Planctomycetes bacterium]|nr:SDR family oxidoreductase [Planctomycetota bacterium]
MTGGASGIGAAAARSLARDGFEVVTVDLDRRARVQGDVRNPETVLRALDVLKTPVYALVNCAGAARPGPVQGLSREDWDGVLGVDLTGAFLFIREVAPRMAEAGGGRIVNVAATIGLRARRGAAAHAAAKAGLVGLTRASARDLGRRNINVNAVAPGVVETAMTADLPAEKKKELAEETCLGRVAQPEDVADVIAFLCGPGARHITGEVIRVDGGQLA